MINRKLGLALSSILVPLALAGCSSNEVSGEEEKKELVVVDWGGEYTEVHDETVFKPFEEKFGAEVTIVTPPDTGKLKSMVESGNVEWDVVSVGNDFAIRAGREGLLEELDFNIIKTDGLPEELVNDYAVPENTFSTTIAYNTESLSGEQPKNWADFWNVEKFPGPRSLYKDPMWTMEAALLADGVEPEKLYPLDVDRAFKKLDEIKKDVKVWWTAGAQPPELLVSKEVPLTSAWSGRITVARDEGAAVNLEYNQGFILSNSWSVPKGAPNKELAMEFIAFSLEVEQQAALSSNYDNAPANKNAIAQLSDERKERLGLSDNSDLSSKQIYIDTEYWVDHYDEVNERFQQWLLE